VNAASRSGSDRSRPARGATMAVLRAFFYLQSVSLLNSMRLRLMRLRQPKYLFGAIAGGLYLYVFLFRRVIEASASGPRGFAPAADPATVAQYGALAAVPLALFVLGSWLFPSGRAALRFSEADIAFLFPAPVTRTTLIHYALLRAQLGIFFSSFLMSLLLRRGSALGGFPLQHAAGIWIVLSTLNLHLLGASFVRERLLDFGVNPLRRRVLVCAALLLAVAACAWSLQGKLAPPTAEDIANGASLRRWAASILATQPLSWLLAPFRWSLAPYFATDGAGFARALVPALALLAAHYVWVVRSQVSFEEASMDLARRRADRVAAMRQGKGLLSAKPARSRRPPFQLAGTGFVPIAFLWKGLLALGPFWRLRTWLIACAVVLVGSRILAANPGGRLTLRIVAIFSITMGGWVLVFGPMLMQRSLREMVENLDILRAGPLRGWEIALGELLSPVVVMAFAVWFVLVVEACCLWGTTPGGGPSLDLVLAAVLGVTLLVPPLSGILLSVPFAGILFFPAWTISPGTGGRGFEVMGQRLILLGGYLVTFALALVPAAGVAALAYVVLRRFPGPTTALVVAAVLACAVLVLEFAAMVDWLGRRIDRFDVSQELPR